MFAGTSTSVPPQGLLLERAGPLAAVDELIATARDGRGSAVYVEAAAGLGKTELLREAGRRGRAAGLLVLTATGGRFEQEHPWGVARTLLEPALTSLGTAEDRVDRPDSAAGVVFARGLDGGGAQPGGHGEGSVLRIAHALFEFVDALAARRPLLVVLDDAHWIDPASMRFALYLLQRLDELPVALLLAGRPGEDTPASPLLDHVAAHPAVRRVPLAPLSPDAIDALLGAKLDRGALNGAAGEVHRLTSGNPFFARRLIEAVADEAGSGSRVSQERLAVLGARSLGAAIGVRVADRGPDAVSVAWATALLGEEATVRRVALLAEMDASAAAAATAALADAQLLEPGEPLRFVHPLVAAAVHDGLPAIAAADGHARAARLLAEDGVGSGRVAAHLLRAPRRADAWTVEQLRSAASRAMLAGDAPVALRLLERALAEPPGPAARADVLAALARARAATGHEETARTFAEALEHVEDAGQRASLRRDQGRWLFTTGQTREAARTFLLARSELQEVDPDHPLDRELRAAYLSVAHFDVDLRAQVDHELRETVEGDEQGRTPAERMLLAQLAFHQTQAAAPPATVRRLCDRAWGADALLADEGVDGDTWTLVCGSLYWTGDLERMLELLEAARIEGERSGSPLGRATVAWCTAPPLLHRGDVDGALAHAETALAARRIGWARHLGSLHRVHARCLIEKGEVEAAAATLVAAMEVPALRHAGEWTLLLEARGRVKLLQGDAAGALADFEEAGEQSSFAEPPTVLPWRSSAALAHHALGRRDVALELLTEELALAERTGVDRAISSVLRFRGLVEGGPEGLASLQAAVDAMPGDLPRLERMHALLELGAALRRAGRRRDAEPPLRAAVAAADAGGATAAADRARAELAVLGARVRRRGGSPTDALTVSEERVALLAADGRTNREIAQELHVTLKTVEFHLSHAFRKLGVGRRTELAAALGDDAA